MVNRYKSGQFVSTLSCFLDEMIPQNFNFNQIVVSMIIQCLFSRKIEIFVVDRLVYREIYHIRLPLTPPSRRIKKNKMQKPLWFLPITICHHSI